MSKHDTPDKEAGNSPVFEVTDEMIEAGVFELCNYRQFEDHGAELVIRLYRAMAQAGSQY